MDASTLVANSVMKSPIGSEVDMVGVGVGGGGGDEGSRSE